MHIANNLKFLRKKSRKTQDTVSTDIKIGRTTLTNYETGFSEPNVNLLIAFANYFGVTLDDLMSKDLEQEAAAGKMPTPKPNGMPMVITVDNSGRENILYVPVKARAGYLLGYGDKQYVESLPAFSMPGLNNGTFRMFEVEGVSMAPNIRSGDRVIGEWVEHPNDVVDNQVYIVVHEGGVAIKRVFNRLKDKGKLYLKSDTVEHRDEFPVLEVSPEEIAEIWMAKLKISTDFTEPIAIYHRLADIEKDMMEMKRVIRGNG